MYLVLKLIPEVTETALVHQEDSVLPVPAVNHSVLTCPDIVPMLCKVLFHLVVTTIQEVSVSIIIFLTNQILLRKGNFLTDKELYCLSIIVLHSKIHFQSICTNSIHSYTSAYPSKALVKLLVFLVNGFLGWKESGISRWGVTQPPTVAPAHLALKPVCFASSSSCLVPYPSCFIKIQKIFIFLIFG